MALEKFVAPAIPIPGPEYSQDQMTQIFRALRLYFNQLDSLTPNQAESYRADRFIGGDYTGGDFTGDVITGNQFNGGDANLDSVQAHVVRAFSAEIDAILARRIVATDVMAPNFYGNYFYGSGRYLNVPYNQFLSNVDQTAPSLGTAYAVQLEVTNFADGIYIAGVNNDQITFSEPGVYSVTYSLSFKNTTNDGQSIDIWIEYNGTNYADSNSRFFIPARKSTGAPSYLIAVTTITGLAQNPNDYIRIMWHPSDVSIVMEHLPAVAASPGVTPAIPATPSAIVQANFISAEFPPVKRVAPLPVFGFGEVGTVTVRTNLG